ncbi:two component sensor kinase [Bordetella pertussis]|nr:two component sensor kinase [Bordetella pertussis]
MVPVWGSEVELHEALSNLVHNAINYAPAGAHITVSVVRYPGRAEVQVADDGPGIEPLLRARAFARFDRMAVARHASSSGSGLGLSIARAYARRNDGDIELRDGEPNAQGGIGLCAVFWIPLYDQSAPADEAEAFRRSG